MAKYHKGLKYHQDNIEKHLPSQQEIEFLANLQKEMNTQDTLGQADPRYWVIKGSEKEYGIESGYEDGSMLIEDESYKTIAEDMPSAMEYIRDNLLDEINSVDGIERKIKLVDGINHPCINIYWDDEEFEDNIEFYNMEDVADWLNENGYDYRVANYRIISKIYPDTMFLTQKEAERHLKANDYHYSEDAHTYAMTSWRNPETEKLWKIIQQVDWDRLKEILKKNETEKESDA